MEVTEKVTEIIAVSARNQASIYQLQISQKQKKWAV
jgi:hypothetical protein